MTTRTPLLALSLALVGCGLLDSDDKTPSAVRTHEGYISDLDTVGTSIEGGVRRYHLLVPVDTAGLGVPLTDCDAHMTASIGRDSTQDAGGAIGNVIMIPDPESVGRTYTYYRFRLDCTEAIRERDSHTE